MSELITCMKNGMVGKQRSMIHMQYIIMLPRGVMIPVGAPVLCQSSQPLKPNG